MTPAPAAQSGGVVLCSCGGDGRGPLWLGEVERGLAPLGLAWARACGRRETIGRVEQGGLAAALLIPGLPDLEGLSLLRTIREIDGRLPCWLVTPWVTRGALQAAFSLRAVGVLPDPVDPQALTLSMWKVLAGGGGPCN
ncbi:MAG TPA: hypothetical protein PKK06_13650 [Phycisphaerae bacterium]|nr:hypothetical protein [Phycisphaerae bacterium]HNU46130.1 hypothetical protein [Phycisphaerae bacterium]